MEHAMKKRVIGIDLGGTSIKGGVFERGCATPVAKRRIPTEAAGGPEHVIERIEVLIDDLLDEVERESIDRIGIGVPGLMDRKAGVSFSLPISHTGKPFPSHRSSANIPGFRSSSITMFV